MLFQQTVPHCFRESGARRFKQWKVLSYYLYIYIYSSFIHFVCCKLEDTAGIDISALTSAMKIRTGQRADDNPSSHPHVRGTHFFADAGIFNVIPQGGFQLLKFDPTLITDDDIKLFAENSGAVAFCLGSSNASMFTANMVKKSKLFQVVAQGLSAKKSVYTIIIGCCQPPPPPPFFLT